MACGRVAKGTPVGGGCRISAPGREGVGGVKAAFDRHGFPAILRLSQGAFNRRRAARSVLYVGSWYRGREQASREIEVRVGSLRRVSTESKSFVFVFPRLIGGSPTASSVGVRSFFFSSGGYKYFGCWHKECPFCSWYWSCTRQGRNRSLSTLFDRATPPRGRARLKPHCAKSARDYSEGRFSLVDDLYSPSPEHLAN